MSGNRRLRYSPEHVYADLRERITDGRWPPGRVLTYADIQQLYGVSRETVATALARLREAGLVETRRMGTRPKVVGESWRLATGTSIQDDITRHVRKLVTEGVYGPGDRIPSLMALAAEHSVSVATVRRAIRPCCTKGFWLLSDRAALSWRIGGRTGPATLARKEGLLHRSLWVPLSRAIRRAVRGRPAGAGADSLPRVRGGRTTPAGPRITPSTQSSKMRIPSQLSH